MRGARASRTCTFRKKKQMRHFFLSLRENARSFFCQCAFSLRLMTIANARLRSARVAAIQADDSQPESGHVARRGAWWRSRGGLAPPLVARAGGGLWHHVRVRTEAESCWYEDRDACRVRTKSRCGQMEDFVHCFEGEIIAIEKPSDKTAVRSVHGVRTKWVVATVKWDAKFVE